LFLPCEGCCVACAAEAEERESEEEGDGGGLLDELLPPSRQAAAAGTQQQALIGTASQQAAAARGSQMAPPNAAEGGPNEELRVVVGEEGEPWPEETEGRLWGRTPGAGFLVAHAESAWVMAAGHVMPVVDSMPGSGALVLVIEASTVSLLPLDLSFSGCCPNDPAEQPYLDLAVPARINRYLRPYQRDGIRFLVRCARARTSSACQLCQMLLLNGCPGMRSTQGLHSRPAR
jgi:hypothetical protein